MALRLFPLGPLVTKCWGSWKLSRPRASWSSISLGMSFKISLLTQMKSDCIERIRMDPTLTSSQENGRIHVLQWAAALDLGDHRCSDHDHMLRSQAKVADCDFQDRGREVDSLPSSRSDCLPKFSPWPVCRRVLLKRCPLQCEQMRQIISIGK